MFANLLLLGLFQDNLAKYRQDPAAARSMATLLPLPDGQVNQAELADTADRSLGFLLGYVYPTGTDPVALKAYDAARGLEIEGDVNTIRRVQPLVAPTGTAQPAKTKRARSRR